MRKEKNGRAAKRGPRRARPARNPIQVIGPMSPEAEARVLDQFFKPDPISALLDAIAPKFPELIDAALSKARADIDRPSTSDHVRSKVAAALRNYVARGQDPDSHFTATLSDDAAMMLADILDPSAFPATTMH